MHRSIGEQEIGAARMQAPKVKHVAFITESARTELVRTRNAKSYAGRQNVHLLHAEDHVKRAGVRLAPARVPPAELHVRARGAFPSQKCHAGPVPDVQEAHPRVGEQNPIVRVKVLAFDAQVTREGDSELRAQGKPRLLGPRIRRTAIDGHWSRQPDMRRIIEGGRGLRVGILRRLPEVSPLDVREQIHEPAGKVIALLDVHAGRKRVVRRVILVGSQANLPQIIAALRALRGAAPFCTAGKIKPISTPRITSATSTSIRVKPAEGWRPPVPMLHPGLALLFFRNPFSRGQAERLPYRER